MANAVEALAAGVGADAPLRRHRLRIGAPRRSSVSGRAFRSTRPAAPAYNLQGSRAAWPESPWRRVESRRKRHILKVSR
jgi:hypothetical protein